MNEVIHGDCLQVMPTLPDKSIDMILCDLPYGTTACKWDSIIPFEPLWVEYKRLIKDNGAIVLTASQPFTTVLINSNFSWFKYEWIWDKDQGGNFANAKRQPLKTHENILVFNTKKYYPVMTNAKRENVRPVADGASVNITGMVQKHSKDYNPEQRYPKSVITISTNNAECNKLNRFHPTQKPVALFEYLIKTYTNEGETVLDNCAGSGTTAIACINTNRNYILIEQEQKYIDTINKRIAENEKQLSIV